MCSGPRAVVRAPLSSLLLLGPDPFCLSAWQSCRPAPLPWHHNLHPMPQGGVHGLRPAFVPGGVSRPAGTTKPRSSGGRGAAGGGSRRSRAGRAAHAAGGQPGAGACFTPGAVASLGKSEGCKVPAAGLTMAVLGPGFALTSISSFWLAKACGTVYCSQRHLSFPSCARPATACLPWRVCRSRRSRCGQTGRGRRPRHRCCTPAQMAMPSSNSPPAAGDHTPPLGALSWATAAAIAAVARPGSSPLPQRPQRRSSPSRRSSGLMAMRSWTLWPWVPPALRCRPALHAAASLSHMSSFLATRFPRTVPMRRRRWLAAPTRCWWLGHPCRSTRHSGTRIVGESLGWGRWFVACRHCGSCHPTHALVRRSNTGRPPASLAALQCRSQSSLRQLASQDTLLHAAQFVWLQAGQGCQGSGRTAGHPHRRPHPRRCAGGLEV